jgi:hypothetical protein
MLIIRQQQLAAFRPGLEAQFILRLTDWAQSTYPELASELGRDGLELRVKSAYHRAKRYSMTSRRDVAKFAQLDLRLGAEFENAPGNDWMKKILETRGLSGPTKVYRIECRLERLAEIAAEIEQEKKEEAKIA